MGLTIHYDLTSSARDTARAKALVERMRQLALDLPFDSVGDLRYLGPDVCQKPLDDLRGDESHFSSVLDGCRGMLVPWHRKQNASVTIQPLEIFSFWTNPGPGSEWAGIGLARYPSEVEMTYRPKDDDKFIKTIKKNGSTRWEFDWRRWQRWLIKNGHDKYELPNSEQFCEKRMVKTRLGGWRYSSFCKTQYASSEKCGGVANFVKCHLCVVHLLDRIAELPSLKVQVDDEGRYGPSHYSDDWRQAHAEGREPTYTWHDGKYNVQALVQEVGEWNEMIAAKFGALSGLLNSNGSQVSIESPIASFPTFERLEFNGSKSEHLQPFLRVMQKLAEEQRLEYPNDDAA